MVIATNESATAQPTQSSTSNAASAAPESAADSAPATTTTPTTTDEEKKKWGYDLYPERKGAPYKPKWTNILLGYEGTENIDKIKCERNVVACIKDSPMVKLMMGALKSSGW